MEVGQRPELNLTLVFGQPERNRCAIWKPRRLVIATTTADGGRRTTSTGPSIDGWLVAIPVGLRHQKQITGAIVR